jgi:alpha-ketoglutarate-dependent taurine dioxygenase
MQSQPSPSKKSVELTSFNNSKTLLLGARMNVVVSKIKAPLLNDPLPVLVEPREAGLPIIEALHDVKELAPAAPRSAGGLLFRGFAVGGPDAFHQFASGFGHPLLPYDFGSTPRSSVMDRVYTSTEYPASQHIPLHNEQSYTREWAMKLWFYCVTPSPQGGLTPIADSRRILQRLDPYVRDRFVEKGLMYVRNYGNGLDVPWQKVFNTERRDVVEAFCAKNAIICEWKADGELRTRQRCQVVEQHPVTGEKVWFNQAHLFHVSGLEPKLRDMLLGIMDEDELPRNAYHADGSSIATKDLDEIRRVIAETAITFSWQAGDVLMIDNMLVAHGRTPFSGNRKVLVAMAERYSNLPSH